ncbi:SapC family protein [Salinimonas sp. HHU 13199]|uniref:SapC family protein n=1 Tax=Salinimonas profundi TaxID=2729140 RepID=A0ABR8LN54_9ALTE|nr:SapC family protein [Salinimonas profundi]MBD3586461.1 SapC family protein [Salinimonas profundi]
MANHVLLNNVEHKNLKIRQVHGEKYNENQMCVPVFPAEMRLAQAHYPLMFAKDKEGNYQMVALLGFEQGENLFLDGDQWLASYKPLVIEKGPFLIGRNDQQPDQLSIHIDMDDDRVNEQDGEAIFLPHGGTTEYTDNISNVLSALHEGQQAHQAFIEKCDALSLIEPFVLDIDMDNAGTQRLAGFFTINEDTFASLTNEQIIELRNADCLESVYMMLASLSQLSSLIRKKKAA